MSGGALSGAAVSGLSAAWADPINTKAAAARASVLIITLPPKVTGNEIGTVDLGGNNSQFSRNIRPVDDIARFAATSVTDLQHNGQNT
jgi:hypothetical protein